MTNLIPPTSKDMQVYYQEDEISLMDLFLVLVRRRMTIVLVLGICALMGILYALVKSEKYPFTTRIEIGRLVIKDGDTQRLELIEKPEAVLAKINDGYIPIIQNNYLLENPEKTTAPKITARVPRNGEVIIVESIGKKEAEELHLTMHQDIVDSVIADHDKKALLNKNGYIADLDRAKIKLEELTDPAYLDVKKKTLEIKLVEAQVDLARLSDPVALAVPKKALESEANRSKLRVQEIEDEKNLLQAQLVRLDEVERLLQKQSSDLSEQIRTVIKRRENALKEMGNEAKAMTMLLIDNEIQQNRNRLSDIEERLYVEVKDERGEITKEMADLQRERDDENKTLAVIRGEMEALVSENKREQAKQTPMVLQLESEVKKLETDYVREVKEQEQTIKDIKNRIASMQITSSLIPPMRSQQVKGIGGTVIVLVSLIVGLFFGVLGAFVHEFLAKAREQIDAPSKVT